MKNLILKVITSTLILIIGLTIKVSAQTVYVTKTGEKFHKSTCRYLSKSKISINLSDAQEKGYTACKVCKPSSKSTTNKSLITKQEDNLPTKQGTSEVASKQCSSKTKSGTRCKRKTKHSSGKCWQHQ